MQQRKDWYLPRFVAITGYARSGKDTSGRTFQTMGYERVALADPLKDLAENLNPCIACDSKYFQYEYPSLKSVLRHYGGWEQAKDEEPGVRQFLIDLGMAGRKTFADGEDFWVNRALERATERPAVFTDVRFLNEAARIRETAGPGQSFVMRVERPASDFESEVPQIEADVVVQNNGTIDDLDRHIRNTFYQWLIDHPSNGKSRVSSR